MKLSTNERRASLELDQWEPRTQLSCGLIWSGPSPPGCPGSATSPGSTTATPPWWSTSGPGSSTSPVSQTPPRPASRLAGRSWRLSTLTRWVRRLINNTIVHTQLGIFPVKLCPGYSTVGSPGCRPQGLCLPRSLLESKEEIPVIIICSKLNNVYISVTGYKKKVIF